eukprot:UN13019
MKDCSKQEKEKVKDEMEKKISEIENLIESFDEICVDDIAMIEEDEKKTQCVLDKVVIDYNNSDELSLESSNIMLSVLRLFHLFSEDETDDKLMSSISANNELMKSLLFFASLPIQFDNPSNWIELEQLQ